jgi:gamma-glutamylcyclotransferase
MYYLSHIILSLLAAWLLLASPPPTNLGQLPFSVEDMASSVNDREIDPNATIYFGYGSNLWLHQMDLRCPTSKYLGVARLSGYKWIINDRGYANVVEVSENDVATLDTENDDKKYGNIVFGLVYSLQPTDEARLDINEGVPIAYTKEHILCDFWASKDGKAVDVEKDYSFERKMLVYIDRNRTTSDKPKKEYIVRMNNGIHDAMKKGVPEAYVKGVMRKFIPEEKPGADGGKVDEMAKRQAASFVDEN